MDLADNLTTVICSTCLFTQPEILRQTPLTFGTAKLKFELSSCEESVQIKMTIWTYYCQAISKEQKIISNSILKQSCLPWKLSRDEDLNDSQQ